MPELEAVWSCIHELHLPPAERGDPLKYNRRVSTDAGFWRALRWWYSALTSDRGEIRRVVHADAPVVQQWSDASSAGWGYSRLWPRQPANEQRWSRGDWLGDDGGRHSTWKELKTVLYALEEALREYPVALRGALVVHFTDCMPAALALGRGTSKSAAFKPILADIRALLTRAGIEAILPWHVSGTVCIAHGCDGLSRSAFLGVFDPDNPAD